MPTRIAGLLAACAACSAGPGPRSPRPDVPVLTVSSVGETHSWDHCPDRPPDRLTELALAIAVGRDVASPSSRLWPRYEPPRTIALTFESDGLGARAASPPASIDIVIGASTACGRVSTW